MSEQKLSEKYGTRFQIKAIGAILSDKAFLERIIDILEPQYFDGKGKQWIVGRVLRFYEEYKEVPELEYFQTEIQSVPSDSMQASIMENLRKAWEKKKSPDLDWVKENFLEFCKQQKVRKTVQDCIPLIDSGEYGTIRSKFNEALSAGVSREVGHDYMEDVDSRMEGVARDTIPTGWPVLDDQALDGGLAPGEIGVLMGATGCHAAGTEIMMYDGTVKKVENVAVGDKLMGPDSSPREVKELRRGEQQMYEITPNRGGEPFVVNKDHVLSLVNSSDGYSHGKGGVVNVTVGEYIEKSNQFQHVHKLRRKPVDTFEGSEDYKYELDPYLIGLLVGDGCFTGHNFSVTTGDETIRDYLMEHCEADHGMDVGFKTRDDGNYVVPITNDHKGDPVLDGVRTLGLYGKGSEDKFVPDKYKYGSPEVRRTFLAGLFDADAHLSKNGYDYVSASEKLADDVTFIARSLGYRVSRGTKHIRGGEYYRAYVTGIDDDMLCRLERKQSRERKSEKNCLRTGFSIEPVGHGDYYGFLLDRDHLYMTADFTVHHNSGKTWALSHIGSEAMKKDFKVVHYTLELSEKQTGFRYDSIFSGHPPNEITENKEDVKEALKFVPGNVSIQHWPANGATTQTLYSHLERMGVVKWKPDLVILDYADLLRPLKTQREDDAYGTMGNIYKDLRRLGGELGVPIWTVSQTQRSAVGDKIVKKDRIADSWKKAMNADFMATLARTDTNKLTDTARIHVAKSRFGPDGKTYPALMSTSTGTINVLDPESDKGKRLLAKMNKSEGQAQREEISKAYQEYKMDKSMNENEGSQSLIEKS